MLQLQISRRALLRGCLAGSLGLSCSQWLPRLAANQSSKRRADSCIVIFLEGGPSQIDTWDPKPGRATGGPFESIDTRIAGVQFSQHMPRLAELTSELAVVRSLTSKEGDHARATTLLHTGYQPSPAFEYPALGSTLARHWREEAGDVPLFVSIGSTIGPGVLGPQFGPFSVQDVSNPAPMLELPEGFSEARIRRRMDALAKFNANFAARAPLSSADDQQRLTERAERMRRSPVFKSYDPLTEVPDLFTSYGGQINDGYLARACLQARRFVEAGVRFVEIQFGGWDTHANNFEAVQNLSASLDAALAALVSDLKDRGMLDRTLVACFGEFGRTPQINGDNGRDHFPDAFSAVLAGGGLRTGQVVGTTDDDGTAVKERPVSVADFHATIYTALGLEVDKNYFAPDGRLMKLTDHGQPLRELMS